MSKFAELAADKVLEPKTETLLLTHTVSNPNWLYMPKFILVRRVGDVPGSYANPPINFRVELVSPVSATPFVMDEFVLTSDNLRRVEGITIWGHQDHCNIYAKCEAAIRVQILVSCMIDTECPREEVGGFSLVITETAEPNGFSFGTSEISSHTTYWEFGDGASGNVPATSTIDHAYAGPGTYTVSATCHGVTETMNLDTNDPPVYHPLLDTINPDTIRVGGPMELTLTGSDFATPMLVRFWSASTFMGTADAQVLSTTSATVLIDTTGWLVGTGGVDVVVDGKFFSNQLQIPVK